MVLPCGARKYRGKPSPLRVEIPAWLALQRDAMPSQEPGDRAFIERHHAQAHVADVAPFQPWVCIAAAVWRTRSTM